MSSRSRRDEVGQRLLYYDVLFSTLLKGYDMGIIIEDLLEEVTSLLDWDKGLADIDMDGFIGEVREARELNRRFIQMELDVDWSPSERET